MMARSFTHELRLHSELKAPVLVGRGFSFRVAGPLVSRIPIFLGDGFPGLVVPE